MITSILWVPRGRARQHPLRYEISKEEIKEIEKRARVDGELAVSNDYDDGQTNDNNNQREAVDAKILSQLKLDKYDDSDDSNDNNDDDDLGAFEEGNMEGQMDFEAKTLAIVDPGTDGLLYADENYDDEDSDAEDNEIKPSDAVLLVARAEEDYSILEVQIYEENSGSFYTHHDITLPAFPLTMDWLDIPPTLSSSGDQTGTGSFVAIGSFEPAIEIWNLDVLDPLEPSATLGGYKTGRATISEEVDKKNKKKKGAKVKQLKDGSHADGVLSVSWNRTHRQILASGSADKTVKVWDVTTQVCSHTFTHHTNKVQSVQWHPNEGTVLATGSFDRSVIVLDGRQPDTSVSFRLSADNECVRWDPHNSFNLAASSEDGEVRCFDIRSNAKPLYSFSAHSKATSCLSFNPVIPGMLASSSPDKHIKIWDTAREGEPLMVASKAMAVGELLTVQFYGYSPYLLATGGSKGIVALWHTEENNFITNHFSSRINTNLLK